MKKTVVFKKQNATVEENVEYLIDKMDYLLKKVVTYDKAINEFQQVKATLDESADNTRKSKDIVKSTFDSISIIQNDIKSLSQVCSELSVNIEEKFSSLNERVSIFALKLQSDKEQLEKKINSLGDKIKQELSFYLTLDDFQEIKEHRKNQAIKLESVISSIQENNLCVLDELKKINESQVGFKEKITSLEKEIARIQNAIFRYRMGEVD